MQEIIQGYMNTCVKQNIFEDYNIREVEILVDNFYRSSLLLVSNAAVQLLE